MPVSVQAPDPDGATWKRADATPEPASVGLVTNETVPRTYAAPTGEITAPTGPVESAINEMMTGVWFPARSAPVTVNTGIDTAPADHVYAPDVNGPPDGVVTTCAPTLDQPDVADTGNVADAGPDAEPDPVSDTAAVNVSDPGDAAPK